MKKIYFLWSLLGLLTLQLGWVQTNITGTVLDETGAPLPGATVVVDGTTRGVATDFDGNFSIQASQGDILVFTYVGYAKQRLNVGSDDNYTITMELSSALEEIIVTGQGSGIERRKLSTTVDVLLEKDIDKLPATQIDQLLQASTPSAQIRLSSGQPGTASIIRTRGPISAATSSTSIVIVDGIRVDNLNSNPDRGITTGGGRCICSS